ncbi:MAG: transposase family protein [Cytophagaceae bacterium]|nr:transposase family protein [Cytophagaceae bacterium]
MGKTHDYKQLKGEFSADFPWFSEQSVGLDSGYQGFAKDYDCQYIMQPTKKPKGGESSTSQKAENTRISSERIYVENAISGLKRYRYLSDRLRTHHVNVYETALLVCAGIWNFYLTN